MGKKPLQSPITEKTTSWRDYTLPENTLTGLRRNDATFCGLTEARLLLLVLGAADRLSDGLKTLNSSHSKLSRQKAWWLKHYDAEMFLILECWAYLSCTRDHGSVWIHQNTWKGHVVLCRRGNALETDVSTRQWPQTHQKMSSIWVPD